MRNSDYANGDTLVLPVISPTGEKVVQLSKTKIQIHKKETGVEYIKIIQNIGETKSVVLINPNNLDTIIETLINFKEDIALNQKIKEKHIIREEDKDKIIKSFLRGVMLKDLSLQFGYDTNIIRALLTLNEIEIIEGITINLFLKDTYQGKNLTKEINHTKPSC